MARRALRKIEKMRDISRHLLEVEALPEPWDPEEIFERTGPIELEIGSGKGLFIRKAAVRCPEHLFLGIEIARKYAELTAHYCSRLDIQNARMLCADAAKVLREKIPENSLHAVHVYFPDPWWKRRHRKRRILRDDVVRLIENRLEPGGFLHFWTDVKEYFESAIKIIRENTALNGPNIVPEPESLDPNDSRTHFERRTRLHGEPVYRSFFVK